jgi:hypothetical protein
LIIYLILTTSNCGLERYKEALRSPIADLVNTSGRDAGSIKAALFLKEVRIHLACTKSDHPSTCCLLKDIQSLVERSKLEVLTCTYTEVDEKSHDKDIY